MSEEVNWTSGDWRVREDGGYSVVSGNTCICRVNGFDLHGMDSTDRSNAYLLAAAPKLYTELESLTRTARKQGWDVSGPMGVLKLARGSHG